jgi:hypothetical protein
LQGVTIPARRKGGIGMAAESFAIIAVILIMDTMFLRTGKRAAVIISLPLISVPLFYLLGIGVGAGSALSWVPARDVLAPGMVVAGALVGIAGCAAVTKLIKNRKVKTVYLAIGAAYLAALAIVYLMRIVDLAA